MYIRFNAYHKLMSLLAVCRAHRGFFGSGIHFYLLSSPYLCFISLLCLDLYVLGDDALIS